MNFEEYEEKFRMYHVSEPGRVLTDALAYEILSVVSEIPPGKVATYGQIARMIGRERNSRLVGKVLSRAEYYGDFPCHRVVNHRGSTAPRFTEQRALLEAEGVEFEESGLISLRKYRWTE